MLTKFFLSFTPELSILAGQIGNGCGLPRWLESAGNHSKLAIMPAEFGGRSSDLQRCNGVRLYSLTTGDRFSQEVFRDVFVLIIANNALGGLMLFPLARYRQLFFRFSHLGVLPSLIDITQIIFLQDCGDFCGNAPSNSMPGSMSGQASSGENFPEPIVEIISQF